MQLYVLRYLKSEWDIIWNKKTTSTVHKQTTMINKILACVVQNVKRKKISIYCYLVLNYSVISCRNVQKNRYFNTNYMMNMWHSIDWYVTERQKKWETELSHLVTFPDVWPFTVNVFILSNPVLCWTLFILIVFTFFPFKKQISINRL